MFRFRFCGFVALLLSLCATWQATQAQTSSKSNQLALAHVAPEECVFFVTWNGWTEPDPKSTNRTEQLFAEESLRDFIKQLGTEIDKLIENAAKSDGSQQATVAAQAMPLLVKTALTHPGAVYLKSFVPAEDPQFEAALVIDAQADGTKSVDALKKLLTLTPKDGPEAAIEEKIGGATFMRPKEYRANMPRMRLGYMGSYLIATLGDESAKTIVDKLSKPGQPVAWVTQLSTELAVERPSMLSRVDVQTLLQRLQPVITDPMATRVMGVLGVSNLKHWSSVSGLSKTGMQVNSVIVTDGKPTGLFDLLPEKPLSIDDFRKVPATATNATVVKLDLDYAVGQILKGVDQIDPSARQQVETTLEQMEPQLGFSPRKDFLAALGDTWTIYASGSEPGAMMIPGLVLTASVRDQPRLAKAQDILVNAARAALTQLGPQAPFSIQDFSARGEKGFRIQFNGLPIPVAPAWVLTKDQLVVGLTPQLVTSHLSGAKTSLADNDAVKAAFQRNAKPSLVSYSDPKPGLQGLYTLVNTFGPVMLGQLAQQGINFNLPPLPPISDLEKHLAPSVTTFSRMANGWRTETHGVVASGVGASPAVVAVGAALLLPAVQQAREAARRSQGKNNLKQIGLAMHNFHDVYRAFPGAASTDKKGKQLLSWRVHVLPFVDAADLYQQFHLDEPWDSEHNKKLVEKIPPVFIDPSNADLAKDGKTVYLAIRGAKTVFENDGKTEGNIPQGLGVRDITDGTSNTIMVAEAHRDAAVIWTKPDDLVIDFKNPLKGLKSSRPNGFQVLFCDGSVRFISDAINLETLKALFTRNGGEAVGEF